MIQGKVKLILYFPNVPSLNFGSYQSGGGSLHLSSGTEESERIAKAINIVPTLSLSYIRANANSIVWASDQVRP